MTISADNKRYIESQINCIHFSNRERPYIKENLIDCCNLMAKRFDLKLRDINLLLTRISLISCSISINHYFYEFLLISLLILRDQNKELYDRYTESPSVADEIISFIGQGLSLEERQSKVFCCMIGYLIAPIYDDFKCRDRYNELMQPYKESAQSTDHPTNKAGQIVLNVISNIPSSGIDKLTIARIEFLQQFTIDN